MVVKVIRVKPENLTAMISTELTGYLNPQYAESFIEFGTPLFLPNSGGWLLTRPIPGTSYRDAMGLYPLFACQDWSKMKKDIDHLQESGLISLVLVTDPFGAYDISLLEKTFPLAKKYKEHFIVDLQSPISDYLPRNHKYNIRKATQVLTVKQCDVTKSAIDEWVELYAHLTARHNIQGITQFSRNAFIKQFKVPGFVLFKAQYQEQTIGMLSWYIMNHHGYAHLCACNQLGYELGASFALIWHSIKYFSSKVRWLDIGAGPDKPKDCGQGLVQFKRGWSSKTLPVFLCGRIFDNEKYEQIVSIKNKQNKQFFPAYRA